MFDESDPWLLIPRNHITLNQRILQQVGADRHCHTAVKLHIQHTGSQVAKKGIHWSQKAG